MIQASNQTRRSKVPFIPEEQINFDFKYDRILFDQESGKFFYFSQSSRLRPIKIFNSIHRNRLNMNINNWKVIYPSQGKLCRRILEKNINDPTVEKLVEYEAERGKIVQSFDISSKRRAIIAGSNKGLESLKEIYRGLRISGSLSSTNSDIILSFDVEIN